MCFSVNYTKGAMGRSAHFPGGGVVIIKTSSIVSESVVRTFEGACGGEV
jgi:hypothetical protein